jgi:hypothetical protein
LMGVFDACVFVSESGEVVTCDWII